MTSAHLDFESRSAVDLRAVGLDNYSRHTSTDVWCAAWAIGDGEIQLWTPGQPIPSELAAHVAAGGTVTCHNWAFEYAIWTHIMTPRYGWPSIEIEQFDCTMCRAYAMGLPGSLENAAAAVGIEEQKDQVGGRVMMQMARPRSTNPDGTYVWWNEQEKLDRLFAYCKTDVAVERALDQRLMKLSADERKVWRLDAAVNLRGIYVDRDSAKAALAVVDGEQRRLAERISVVTGAYVGLPSENARLTEWVRSRGVPTGGIAKSDVVDLLADESIPDDVREALTIRQEYAKSSTAKLKPMVEAASRDGRLRGMFQYHGASTGRWAGRRVQLHNLPRPRLAQSDIEDVFEHLDDRDYIEFMYGSPMSVMSDCLRGMLCAPPGKLLVAGDFANIEGRVLAWLAGEEWKLTAFKEFDNGTGPDLYLVAAARIFRCAVEAARPQRQVGKVAELALGYGGGVGAFQTMARAYGVEVGDTRADEIKAAWRAAHPNTVRFWYSLEKSALAAVLNAGRVETVGSISFKRAGSFLWCRLPSGRVLCYPYPLVGVGKFDNDCVTYMAVNSVTNKWERTDTYGGKLAENVTQAVARDCLSEAMLRLDADGFPIVAHVHDEIVAEIDGDEARSESELEHFLNEMRVIPPWAKGLPIAVEGWVGRRYRK